MKKYILAVMALVVSALGMRAEDITVFSLFVNTMAGDAVEYQFADEPVATFEGENLLITTAGAAAVEYPMADVKNINFKSKKVSGVEEISTDDHVVVRLTKSSLYVGGMAEGAEVSIYSLDGRLMAKGTTAEGAVEISIEELPQGVYAAAIPGHSFKFTK